MQVLLWQNKQLQFRNDYPQPVPGPGEALIQVLLAGICNTDLEIQRGYLDFSGVPGHEFVGRVVESANPQLVGQRVVGEINCACGSCSYCQAGLQRHCPQRTVLGIVGKDGAFAQYLTLPEQNLHLVPDSVSNEEAVFTEPLAAAWEILEQVEISPQDEVLVMGDGKLGLLIAQVIRTTDCQLLVVGKHPENLDLLQSLGIQTKPLDQLRQERFDIVIEASGSSQGLGLAIEHTRPRGKIVLKTTVAEEQPLNPTCLVINELILVGSRCGPFAPALKSLAEGQVQVKPLIGARYSLSQGRETFQKAAQPGVLKILLDIER